jgi:hypothetical protein
VETAVENGRVINAEVGGPTPDGRASYIRLRESRDVYAVDYTWVEVLQRLVREPPYPQPEAR